MTEENVTYRKILKATSLFGSVQIVSMISSLIKTKILAVLIGPAGYGIYGVLNTTIDLIKQLSGIGIETSSVKYLAESKLANDTLKFHESISVVIKLSFILGVIGTVITILIAPFLSFFTFENMSKWYVFMFLSVTILFKQLTSSNNAIFQAGNQLQFLAKSNLYANVGSLFLTIPLFYFYKIDAIVPSIIVVSVFNYVVSLFYIKKLKIIRYKMKIKETFQKSREILFFGSLLVIMSFLPLLVNFLLQLVINDANGIREVGLFNVAMLVLNTYVGFVFSIMATEYYPRLVSIGNSILEISKAVSQQIIISSLLIVPIIVLFIGFGGLLIELMFSKQFVSISKLLNWAILGMFFKAISFSIGYVFIAKADSKVFTKTSVIFNCLYFIFCIIGYKISGLEGIGVAILCYYCIHLVAIYTIAKKRYSLILDASLQLIFFIGFVFCSVSYVISTLENSKLMYLFSSLLLLISISYSIFKLSKLGALKNYFKRK